VRERSTAYEPRVEQASDVEDEQLRGRQEITFTSAGDDVDIELSLHYELKAGGPFMVISDLLFIRRAQRDSLRRTLHRFALELGAERELTEQ
jgi:hypothetical protein